MLGWFAKLLLALTSLSPVAFTWAIVDFDNGFKYSQIIVLGCAIFLAFLCIKLISISEKKLTRISISVQTIKAVDNEVVAYIITYLFPLIAPNSGLVLLISIFLFLACVLSTSNAFTFNPILTLAGYHFYEVQNHSGVSYLLLSKNEITNVSEVRYIGRLSKHLMLDLS